MKTNQDYKNEALSALQGNWAPAIIATIVLYVILCLILGPNSANYYASSVFFAPLFPVSVSAAFSLLTIFVLLPLQTGYMNSLRSLVESGDNRLTNNMFNLGFSNWLHLVWGCFVMYIFIFLWSLLFIIPGIIKGFSYAMTPYILVEHPEMSVNQAIDESRRLMRGHKFDYFYLLLSFIGWVFLSILTAGIGLIWLTPYVYAASAAFYKDLKGSETSGGVADEKVLDAERVL